MLDSEKDNPVDMSGLGYSGRARLGTEVDNELDQVLAEAEEADRDIDRLLAEAGFDVTSMRNPEISAPSNTVEASSEAWQSTGDGDAELYFHLRPSASPGAFSHLRPSLAAVTIRRSMEYLRTLTAMRSTVNSESATPDEIAKLAFLRSLPVLPASDHPEAVNTCPICQEAFKNTARPEVPVRLPCHHVFGALCISSWISIKRTCPLCRSVLFEPNSPSTPVGGGEAEGSATTTQPVRQSGLPRFAPRMLILTEGSEEEIIRRLEAHILELIEQFGWLTDSSNSLAWDPRRDLFSNTDDVVAQLQVCLRSTDALKTTLRSQLVRYL